MSKWVLVGLVAALAVGGLSAGAFATEPLTLTVPVDMQTQLTEVRSKLGEIVAAVVVIFFGFMLVLKGMKWGRKIA